MIKGVEIGDVIEHATNDGIEPFRVTGFRRCHESVGIIGEYLHLPVAGQKETIKIWDHDLRADKYRVRATEYERQLQQLRDVQARANCRCDGGRIEVIPLAEYRRAVAATAQETQRANAIADQAGVLRDEQRDLLAENATLRREIEALRRHGRRS